MYSIKYVHPAQSFIFNIGKETENTTVYYFQNRKGKDIFENITGFYSTTVLPGSEIVELFRYRSMLARFSYVIISRL